MGVDRNKDRFTTNVTRWSDTGTTVSSDGFIKSPEGDGESTIEENMNYLLIFGVFFMLFVCLHRSNKGKKKKILTRDQVIKQLSKARRVVEKEDFVDDNNFEKDIEKLGPREEKEEHQLLTLPTPGNVADELGEVERKITNCCSICLCGYEPGATVVWSANPNCPHVFHEDCILHWIVKSGKPKCPYCRRNFLGADAESLLPRGGDDLPTEANSPSERSQTSHVENDPADDGTASSRTADVEEERNVPAQDSTPQTTSAPRFHVTGSYQVLQSHPTL